MIRMMHHYHIIWIFSRTLPAKVDSLHTMISFTVQWFYYKRYHSPQIRSPTRVLTFVHKPTRKHVANVNALLLSTQTASEYVHDKHGKMGKRNAEIQIESNIDYTNSFHWFMPWHWRPERQDNQLLALTNVNRQRKPASPAPKPTWTVLTLLTLSLRCPHMTRTLWRKPS